ncbi:hypothetical protein ACP4OV_020070 [Aristida adscensionis]
MFPSFLFLQSPMIQAMDAQSCMKLTLSALTILSMVTCLPRMYSCVRAFLMESLPSIVSAIVAPKCLFVFSNIIVVFLVSESKLLRIRSDPRSTNDNDTDAKGEGSVPHHRGDEEGVTMEHLLPTMIIGETIQGRQEDMVVEEERGTLVVHDGLQMDLFEGECDVHVASQDTNEMKQEEKEEGELVQGDLVRVGVEEEHENKSTASEELEERDLPPADELNRRVEDFIARFNMERQLEAKMLVCCY